MLMPLAAGNYLFLGGEVPGGPLKRVLFANALDRALSRGELRPGQLVAEASAGSSALALAKEARLRGLRARLYVPDSLEDLEELRASGAQVMVMPTRATALAQAFTQLDQEHRAGRLCWMRQNFNPALAEGYAPLAAPLTGLPLTRLVAAVGSGAMLRGFADHLTHLAITAVYARGVRGLRPVGVELPMSGDCGSAASLRERYGDRLTVVEVDAGTELPPGLSAAASTAAVLEVMRPMQGAIAISADGYRK